MASAPATNPRAKTVVTWWYALCIMAGTLWASVHVISATGLLALNAHEPGGDIAGWALQARKGLATGLFYQGHTSDIRVAHPGPLLLQVYALGDVVSSAGIGGTPYTTATAALLTLRLLCICLAALAVAATVKSRAAGLVFLAVASVMVGIAARGPHSGRPHPVAEALFTFNVLDPYLLKVIGPLGVGLTAATIAWIRGVSFAPPLMLFFGAALVHVHTTAVPAGALGVAVGLAYLWKNRQKRPKVWYATLAVALFMLGPMFVRVLLEPGWPFTYLKAWQLRGGAMADTARQGDPWSALNYATGLSNEVVAVLLLAAGVAGAIFLTKFPPGAWRRAGLCLTALGTVGLAGWALTFQGAKNTASVDWLGGVLVCTVAYAAASGVAAAGRAMALRKHPAAAKALVWGAGTAAVTFTTTIVAVAAVAPILPRDLYAGPDETVVWQEIAQHAQTQGKTPGLVVGNPEPTSPMGDWLVYYPLVLAAERTGSNYCLAGATGIEATLRDDWTIADVLQASRVCDLLDPGVLPIVHVVVPTGSPPLPGEVARTESSAIVWASARLPGTENSLAFVEATCHPATRTCVPVP